MDFSNAAFVDIYVQPGTRKRMRFPRIGATQWNEVRAGVFHTSTAGWLPGRKHFAESEPDLKIPFSSSERSDVGSLFVQECEDSFRCTVDLPFSTLLTLSRFEETLPGERDLHSRFSAFSSVAWRDGFLHRPIVDEYGLAIQQVLTALLPNWNPPVRRLRLKISHDVDELGIPFSLRGALARTFRDGRPWDTVRDLFAPLLSPVLTIDTAHQHQLKRIVQFSAERQINSAVYWKASQHGPHDTGYDPRDIRITNLMKALRSKDVEMGIHPGYASFDSPETFRSEVQTLREVLGEHQLGGRQDYLRWNPETWVRWNAIGLGYDSSVGFADHTGFRAGTSFPYRPWLWSQQRTADLVEIPLLATDSSMQSYMKLTPDKALQVLRNLLARCRAVGGVFCLAWHNTRILHPGFRAAFQTILDELRETPTYDWRSPSS
jgi:hypothetical protein